MENDDSDKENVLPSLENNGSHCCLKRVSEQHTPNGKYGIRTLGDAYPNIAGLISNTTVDGDSRPMKHETIWKQGLNIEEKGQKIRNNIGYKRNRRRLPKDTTNALINMQNSPDPNPQSYHPHSDISTAHTLRNPVIQAELSSALFLITFPEARITEFNYNSHIPDSYFAKVYLPNAKLTGYKNSILKTAEGRVFACIHFNPSNHRIFELAGLNAPDSESHVPNHNNVEVPTCPSTAPSTFPPPTTNHYVTRPSTPDPRQATTRPFSGTGSPTTTSGYDPTAPSVSCSLELLDLPTVAYHITAALPTNQPNNLPKTSSVPKPLPTFLLPNDQAAYDDLITFGSTPTGDQVAADSKNTDMYTRVEWLFLVQVLDYC